MDINSTIISNFSDAPQPHETVLDPQQIAPPSQPSCRLGRMFRWIKSSVTSLFQKIKSLVARLFGCSQNKQEHSVTIVVPEPEKPLKGILKNDDGQNKIKATKKVQFALEKNVIRPIPPRDR